MSEVSVEVKPKRVHGELCCTQHVSVHGTPDFELVCFVRPRKGPV